MEKGRYLTYQLLDQTLHLDHRKVVYWADQKVLIVSDAHFGKISHFKKEGINLPLAAAENNFTVLQELFEAYDARMVVFLGDLFHSRLNDEWHVFCQLIDQFPQIRFILTKGNHDILDPEMYIHSTLEIMDHLHMSPFLFSHDALEGHSELYHIYGHIHPAVRLRGKGNVHLRLPCFYFEKHRAILPSFGTFTGGHVMDTSDAENVFVCTDSMVFKVK